MRVLVVDDDASLREALRRALSLEGYEVELAADGVEALGFFHDERPPPDAVVLDVLMPRLDGWETCRAIRLRSSVAEDKSVARLRETLRVFLEENGSFQNAAARLGVHKNTVAYRIHRAEELLGHGVKERQLELETALRLDPLDL